jgi:hypothetical protein
MDELAVILADMIRSALAWEAEHGVPPHDNPKTDPSKALTSIPLSSTVNIHENKVKGDSDEYQNDSQKR